MITADQIAAALNVTGGTLATEGNRATFTCARPLTTFEDARVQAWWDAGEVSTARIQKTDIVLSRLTDAEYDSLTSSTVIGIRRAVDLARSTGVIADNHPAFAPFVAGAAALGIIAANRWDALLAP